MADKHVITFAMVAGFFKDAISQLQRGENSYRSGYVQSMVFDKEVNPALLKGTVTASMKKRAYSVEVSIDIEDGVILDANCSCPRGLVICHHVAALCIHAHHNVSVTDQACTWSAHKYAEENVKTLSEMFPKQKQYQAVQGHVTEVNVQQFLAKLGPGNVVGFSWLLRPEAPTNLEINIPSIEDIVFCGEYLEASDKRQYIINRCCLTQHQIDDVAQKTVGQSKNENWLIARKNRLTASNFGAVLAAVKRKRYPPSLFKRLLDGYDLSFVLAVQWGKEHEATAITTFTAAYQDLEVRPSGLWLEDSGFLGASPDGLCNETDIVEVKCPYKFRTSSLSEGLKNDKTYVIYKDEEGATFLNYDHEYYHQIQGQLYLTHKEMCYLIVWTPNECEIVSIPKDEAWSPNLQILRSFYLDKFIPYLSNMNK